MSEAAAPRGRPPKDHTDTTPGWARRLRAAREAAGLTIGELADRVGLEREAVARYDAGERTPNVLVGLALARALGADPRDLYG